MRTLTEDMALPIQYDALQSALEGRTVSKFIPLNQTESISILFSSGTGSAKIFANNSNPKNDTRLYSQNILSQNPGVNGTTAYEIYNASFSSNWIDITSSSVVKISASAIFIDEGCIRYFRVHDAGLTGTYNAFVWTSGDRNHT